MRGEPLQVATATARRKSLKQPPPKMGHPEKFGNLQQQRELSAVNHVAPNRGIPPFLLIHVADHTDTTAKPTGYGRRLIRLVFPPSYSEPKEPITSNSIVISASPEIRRPRCCSSLPIDCCVGRNSSGASRLRGTRPSRPCLRPIAQRHLSSPVTSKEAVKE